MQSRVYSVDQTHAESLMVIPENPPAIAVSAKGWVNTSGWSYPDLTPWIYIAPPKDGILDLDFVATPPTGIALQVLTKIEVAKALIVPGWVVGVRVHTSTNNLVAMLGAKLQPYDEAKVGGRVWPFPWWTPNSARPA